MLGFNGEDNALIGVVAIKVQYKKTALHAQQRQKTVKKKTDLKKKLGLGS